MCLLQLYTWGCVAAPDPVSAGVYQTWGDIVKRWPENSKTDLFLKRGPPQCHKEMDDGMEESAWGMTLGVGALLQRLVALPSSVIE